MSDLATRLTIIAAQLVLPMGLVLYAEKRGEDWILRVGDPGATDNVTGAPMAWKGRKWLMSEHMTDGEIVQTVFLATLTAIEHEIRETFTFRGAAVFDPHYDIEKLVELRQRPDALKERP
jgi:hypothetical protein